MEFAIAQIFDPESFSGLLLMALTALSLTSMFVVLFAMSVSVVQGIWEDLHERTLRPHDTRPPTTLLPRRRGLATV